MFDNLMYFLGKIIQELISLVKFSEIFMYIFKKYLLLAVVGCIILFGPNRFLIDKGSPCFNQFFQISSIESKIKDFDFEPSTVL